MKKKICQILFISLCVGMCNGGAIVEAKELPLSTQQDFLFMHYRQVYMESKDIKEKLDALFAMGEFYFLMSDFQNAKSCFQSILNEENNKHKKMFAYAYLLKMAELRGEMKSSKQLSKELIHFQKNIFIFRNSKQHKFNSPLNHQHKIVYSIEKIEFFIEGDLFEKVIL